MKQKKIIILIATIFLFIFAMVIIANDIENSKKEEKEVETGMKKLEKKFKRRENMLIYVTDDSCELCKETDKMIDFYEKAYNLEFYRTNKEGLTNNDLKEYFGLEEAAIELPAVVYIRDGMLKGIDNKILTEDYFRDYLVEYEFLDKKYLETDYRITYDQFMEKYKTDEKQIIFFYNYGTNIYYNGKKKKNKIKYANREKVREELVKLSKNHNFNYKVVFFSSEGSDKIYQEVLKSTGKKELGGSFIVLTQNSQVTDYLEVKALNSISPFLEKNNIYE